MDAVAAHQSSLKSPSRHMRVGALRYLCAVADAVGECDADNARAAGANDTPANLAECLHRWLKVNEVDVHDTSNGPNVMEFAKTAQVSIAAIRRAVEQEVLGAECAQTLATCGLGALHIRLASVWPETYKLFGALTERKEFEAAWTVLFDDLNEYQVLCLDAHDAAAINAAEHGRKKGEWRDGEGGGEGRRDDAHANAAAEALQRRMENETVPTEQGTERWQRLGLLLRSVASSPPAASRHPAPLAKLFLAFNAPKPDGNRRAGKAWRAGLREWLKVIRDGLSGGKAVRAMTGTGDAVRVILERCVGADEPDLAQLAVRCLGQWRLPHLTADNADRLARVADPNTMKDELISMRVEPGETEEQRACVEPEHRPAFASLVVRCLLPRLKRRTGRFAPHRVAALRWIGKLDPAEIVPLIHSVISPMEPTAVRDVNDAGEDTHGMMVPNTNTPWLDALVVTASGAGGDAMANAWLQLAKDANVSSLVGSGSKVPSGFLRAAGDLLKVMAEHTKAYLHPLMSLTVEMLGASSEICESAARSREARRTDQIEPEAADDDAERTMAIKSSPRTTSRTLKARQRASSRRARRTGTPGRFASSRFVSSAPSSSAIPTLTTPPTGTAYCRGAPDGGAHAGGVRGAHAAARARHRRRVGRRRRTRAAPREPRRRVPLNAAVARVGRAVRVASHASRRAGRRGVPHRTR